MVKTNQYTGLQQYTGRAKRVTPSVARPIAPAWLVRGARWRRRWRPQKYAFSLHFPSQPVYWPSEASNAERSSANSPRLAREGGPLEAPPETPKNLRFRLISHHNRGSKLRWPGVVAVIYTEKIKKNTCNNVAMM